MISLQTYTDRREEDLSVSERANAIIEQAKKCTERGEGRGKAHVFLDHSLKCECGKIDLERARMR